MAPAATPRPVPDGLGRRHALLLQAREVVHRFTGDLAQRTPGAALRFVGRADDVVEVAGEDVGLTEVEVILAQAPGVLEMAVVARPDEIRDVVPVAGTSVGKVRRFEIGTDTAG